MRATLCVVVLLLWLGGCAAPAAKPPPPVPVETAVARTLDVPRTLTGIGYAAASELATIRPQVSAAITKVLFTEGAVVEAGAPLFALDDRPFAAALRQAEAAVERAKAQFQFAGVDATRSEHLVRQGMEAAQLADQARATLGTAKADLAAAEAAVERARLELSWCTVTAPIAGTTGAVGATAGNLVTAGQTALVTIARMQPMHVAFTLPAGDLDEVRAARAAGTLDVTLGDEGAGGAEHGTLDLIDNQADPITGTVRLRAVCANAAARLWPGRQYRVALAVGMDAQAVVVPEQAVQAGQRGSLVWVVGGERTAEPRTVTVRRTVDGLCLIASGLAAGETVVTDGQLRLTKGARIATTAGGRSATAAGAAAAATAAGAP